MAYETRLTQTVVSRIWRAFGLQPHRKETWGPAGRRPLCGPMQPGRAQNALMQRYGPVVRLCVQHAALAD